MSEEPEDHANPVHPRIQYAAELMQSGNLKQAEDILREHMRGDRRNLDAQHLMGLIELQRGDATAAHARFRKLVRKAPAEPAFHCNLGLAIKLKGDLEAAKGAFETALRRKPGYVDALFNLAVTEQDLGENEAALKHYAELLESTPQHYKAAFNLGLLRKQQADPEGAEQAFRLCARAQEDLSDAYWNIATCRRFTEKDDTLETALQTITSKEELPKPLRATGYFTLAKLADDRRDYAPAFEAVDKANALMREAVSSNAGNLMAMMDRAKTNWTQLLSLDLPEDDKSPIPIFILGMPRSGTTLLEQMLDMHPAVEAFGERNDVNVLEAQCSGPETLTDKLAQSFRQHYFRVGRRKPEAGFITDKMPWNFIHLGMIAAVFPQAKILWCKRDRRDVLVSNYFQRYVQGNEFSYSLDDIDAVYSAHTALMAHWRRLLPRRIHEVSYEALVRQPELELRSALDFCGLSWSDDCLDFHQSREAVKTSNWQVRMPLYEHAAGRWQHYSDFLPGEFVSETTTGERA